MTVKKSDYGKVTVEQALNISGFGVFSYLHVVLTGASILAFACLAYSSTVIVQTSACELSTTSAQQGLIAAAPIAGLFVGGIPWGYVGDQRGRRNMLMLSLVVSALLNLVRAISVNWVMLFIMEFVVNVVASGQFMLSMTLLSECVPMAKRNLALLLVTSMFLPGQGVIALIALPTIPLSFSFYVPALGIYWNSWRTLQALYSIPALLIVVCLFFIPESPKFAFSKGDEEWALDILRTIYRRNHRKSKDEFPVKGLIKEDQKTPEKPTSTKEYMVIFKQPLLKYTIIMTILFICEQVGSLQIWFPTIANRFMQMVETGASMNQTLCDVLRANQNAAPDPDAVPCSLNSTAMLIILASGSFQSIANLLLSTIVNIVGRRNIVIVLTAVCGVSGILVNLVPNTIASAVLFIILLLGYIVLGLYTAISVAIFPTHVRALVLSFAMSGGRVATIAAIQLLNYLLVNNCDAGYYIFGTLFAFSAVAASFLPDDRRLAAQGQDLKKTVQSTRL